MPDPITPRLGLPLLQPAQAQKHVTLNEALLRLDGLVNLTFVSTTQATPPGTVVDGLAWAVPGGAVNAWAGQEGKVAIGSNGGWVFVSPRRGWRAQDGETGAPLVHDGTGWLAGAVTMAPSGAGLSVRVTEAEVTIAPGGSMTSDLVIPAQALVVGVTARVTQAITGPVTSWSLGTAEKPNWFSSGLGKGAGSWARGLLGMPTAIYDPQPLVLTPAGGNFDGGRVRLALHWWELRLPA